MTDIKIVNENGKIVGKDVETGETVPIELGETVLDSVSTDEITSRIQIDAGDDAQSMIESATGPAWIQVEPGATFDITPPFEPPASTFIDAGTSSHHAPVTTFQKVGDGDMMSVPSGLWLRGIEFDGQRSSYTGNGLVDRNFDGQNIRMVGCTIRNMAGHCRVHDAAAYCYYENDRFLDSDGYAIRNITTDHDGFRRSTLINCRSSFTGGFLKSETSDRFNEYRNIRVTSQNGPGIHIDNSAEGVLKHHLFTGHINDTDGPHVYVESGGLVETDFGVSMANGGRSVSVPTTAPVGGIVHVEGSSQECRMTFSAGRLGVTGSDAGAGISNQSGNNLRVLATGADATGSETIEGQVILTAIDVERFAMARPSNFNGSAGYALDGNFPGEGRLVNLDDGQSYYFGWWGNPPEASPAQGSFYVDSGSNTGDGEAGIGIYDGSAWTYTN
ncbi:hypothetical protein SAMN06269185_3286 [Natronoarchaeum philippinense]|uniref:Uncharacterized protein n=1 Tax=Natronoarchaeum philippinense TaxID=558529 RepID=A0A285P8W0_NATPI|nr:hypothetical protein [Natronoarchaeum philippinense]SNZ18189.1 hypothetical protein SAMN06269185_3286 [Natronoarchaeum philippinense]